MATSLSVIVLRFREPHIDRPYRVTDYEVMRLAGHADFKTTHKFYLSVADDLKDRAREVTARGLCQKLVQIGADGIF